jgi:hypothetical protein
MGTKFFPKSGAVPTLRKKVNGLPRTSDKQQVDNEELVQQIERQKRYFI